jgi:hypothetical protein
MKTYRTLGILWLTFCSYSEILLLRQLSRILAALNFSLTPDVWLGISLCLLYLAGVVAGIFLFSRGALWVRWFLGLIAVWSVVGTIEQFVTLRSLSVFGGIAGVFALVSVVLLFLPRHEPVA